MVDTQPFHMKITDVFSVGRSHCLVVGDIDSGTVRVGETVEFGHQTATVLEIERFRKGLLECVGPGRAGLMLNVSKEKVEPGQTMCKVGRSG